MITELGHISIELEATQKDLDNKDSLVQAIQDLLRTKCGSMTSLELVEEIYTLYQEHDL